MFFGYSLGAERKRNPSPSPTAGDHLPYTYQKFCCESLHQDKTRTFSLIRMGDVEEKEQNKAALTVKLSSSVLNTEPRSSCSLGKCSATELQTSYISIFWAISLYRLFCRLRQKTFHPKFVSVWLSICLSLNRKAHSTLRACLTPLCDNTCPISKGIFRIICLLT